MHEADIRIALEKHRRRPVPDKMWKYVVDRGFVGDVAASGIDGLAEEVERIEQAGTARPEKLEVARPEGPSRGQERRWALSQLVAEEMKTHQRIQDFRTKHLRGRLLDWADVEGWITEQAAHDSTRKIDLTVTIEQARIVRKPGTAMRLDPALELVEPGSKLERRVLDYAIPEEDWVRRCGVSAGGTLDTLRWLSEWLSDNCAWQPAQGTVFVLSGVVPLIPAIRATASMLPQPGWNSRIQLDIDPATSPDEVLAFYQSLRREHGLARQRTIKPKLARLAAFAMAEHAEKPWKERQLLWNERFPHWRYDHGTNFRRDAIGAKRRLLAR